MRPGWHADGSLHTLQLWSLVLSTPVFTEKKGNIRFRAVQHLSWYSDIRQQPDTLQSEERGWFLMDLDRGGEMGHLEQDTCLAT